MMAMLAALLVSGCGSEVDKCTEAAVKAEEQRITTRLTGFYTDNADTREYIKKKLADGRLDLEAQSRLACMRAAGKG
jgi:hypothetical protein